MTELKLTTFIKSSIDRCFDLSRSIDLHTLSTKRTGERAIAGRTSGLIEKGESVTWEAVHFGISQRLTSIIVEMRRPYLFIDEMTDGAFKSIHHEHHFENKDDGTLMTDHFCYETPYGFIGGLFDKIILKRYMAKLLVERNAVIKRIAEGDERIEILQKQVR